MNAPDIARNLAQDIADAKALNVTKTPEFFVNGKPMPSFGYEQLTALVNDALVDDLPIATIFPAPGSAWRDLPVRRAYHSCRQPGLASSRFNARTAP